MNPSNSAPPRIAVVLLHWKNEDDTLACLESLKAQEGISLRLLVIFNGPTSDVPNRLLQVVPSESFMVAGRNLGYAGGNNVAMQKVLDEGYDQILVLNNDTVLAPDCLLHLCRAARAEPNVGAVAPKSYYLSRRDIIYFAGGRISPEGYTEHVGVGLPDGPQYDQAADCDWLTGCAILFRAEALRRVGLFEPRYFLCYEDSDWCLRARRAGYRLRYAPEARLWHKVSPNFGQTWSPSYTYYFTRNNLWWIERNFPPGRRPALYRHALARIQWLTASARPAMSPTVAAGVAAAIRAGVRDYVLRRFGQRHTGLE